VPDDVVAPYLSYDKIRYKAEEFLLHQHPQRTIPVPIEEIVEFNLGRVSVPIPDLRRTCDVDGFLTGDLRSNMVDASLLAEQERRYRFTLAHEVGHLILHGDVYRRHAFHSISVWKAFMGKISDEEHRWFESHAYAFAGLVLVPGDDLQRYLTKTMEWIQRRGIFSETHREFAWDWIEDALAEQFSVSREVIHRRMDKDRLRERFSM